MKRTFSQPAKALKKLMKPRQERAGLAPGSLIHIGVQKVEQVEIDVLRYDPTSFDERKTVALPDLSAVKESLGGDESVTWINVIGIHDVDVIQKIGELFDIHRMVLEDVLDTDQRPKFEALHEHLFFVMKMVYFPPGKTDYVSEQVSVVCGPNYVITFQERADDVFDSIRQRLREGKGKIRALKADYLCNALLDSVVDHYFVVIEKLSDSVTQLEESLMSMKDMEAFQTLHNLKRELIVLRRAIWPTRELVNTMQRSDSPLIHEETLVYTRDVYDQTIQLFDVVESFRELLNSMVDLYLSMQSHRMNSVMQVLTIFASIFIPLTFIAGIYGMNFDHMPELHWKMGYPAVWAVMILVTLTMLIYFKKKRWF